MAEIATRTNHTTDATNYTSIATNYIDQWTTLAMSNDSISPFPAGTTDTSSPSLPHTTLNYNNASTYSLLYNLYTDKELSLSLIPDQIYTQQSSFYPTVNLNYGVPLDTRHNYTKADWQMFCAAIASAETRDMFVDDVAKWLAQTGTDLPFSDLYETVTGEFVEGTVFDARPVVGGMFALLALPNATQSASVGERVESGLMD